MIHFITQFNQKTVTDFLFSVFPMSCEIVGTDILVSFETSSTDVHCTGGSIEQYLAQDYHKPEM